jgi:uncharacterized protein with HEPN domain
VRRHDLQRIDDILAAIAAIQSHVARGDVADGLVFDAVRARLIEIGESVKHVSADVLATEAAIPWAEIAGLRDRLAHRYFDTSHAIVRATVDHDVPELELAAQRLRAFVLGRVEPDQ